MSIRIANPAADADTFCCDTNGILERLHALEVTAARLAAERDEARAAARNEKLRTDALQAAGERIAADAITREESLAADLRAERGRTAALERANAALETVLADGRAERRRLSEHVARLVADNTAVRTELADAQARVAEAAFRRPLRRWRPTTDPTATADIRHDQENRP